MCETKKNMETRRTAQVPASISRRILSQKLASAIKKSNLDF